MTNILNRKVTVEVDYIGAELTSNGWRGCGSSTVRSEGRVTAVQEDLMYVTMPSGAVYIFFKTIDNNGIEVWANNDIGDGAQVVFHEQ
jgi:hypothetical protein